MVRCSRLINSWIPLLLAVGVIVWLAPVPASAATPSGQQMYWVTMGIGLLGGLALFLFGMEQMTEALQAAAGERLKVILAKLTTNRVMSALTGAFVTAVIQSSSVTTVLVVGFVSAGLLTMTQSVGIIMGANVGTTVTAQIIAFQVTRAALAMVAAGFGILFFSRQQKIKSYGAMLMGLGLVFFGMTVMSDSMKPLHSYQPFLDLMATMENPLIAILIAAVFTGLVQSSSATTGIVILMATQGFITSPIGIALVFGSNIGTCITAILAAIGKPRDAVRAAMVHVAFNVFGVLLWLGFITELWEFVAWISPVYEGLTGTEKLAAEAPRQIANAHTVFNVTNTVVFIGFADYFARLASWLLPDKPAEEEKVIIRPNYLDQELIQTPSLALERVRLETGRLGEITETMLAEIKPAFLDRSRERFEEISKMKDQVEILQGHILNYLGQIRQHSLTDVQSRDFLNLMNAADNFENIGDVIGTNLVRQGHKALDENIGAGSETIRRLLIELHGAVLWAVEAALHSVRDNDQRAAQDVVTMKDEINHLVESALQYQAAYFAVDEPKRLSAFRLEMELSDGLNRIYTLATRIANVFLPEELTRKLE